MTTPHTHESTAHTEGDEAPGAPRSEWRRQFIGLFIGLGLAVLVFFFFPSNAIETVQGSAGADPEAEYTLSAIRTVAAVTILMGVWWMTEAIPLAATALLPLVIFPLAGVGTIKEVGAPYASATIFLFMGGFLIALSLQRWNLHRRLALYVVKLIGTSPRRLILGFMLATGFLSMWVSNTATAVVMLPIGTSVLALTAETVGGWDKQKKFATALMLGIAYSASIGSLGTLIGTPPNALLAAFMRENYDVQIGFGQWMLVGVPIAVVLLFACWFLLTRVLFRPEIDEVPGGRDLIATELARLGRMSAPEAKVLAVFVLAALAWITVPLISEYVLDLESPLLSDAAIAMVVGLILFLLPAGGGAGRGVRLLDWEAAKELPWGVLLLFGGGLALSGQFSKSGLSTWLGEQVKGLGDIPVWVLVVIAAVGILLLTEMTSNTATAATFLPVASGVALGTGVAPLMLAAPVALAATCAFMLPVATPPNAIAYGSGYVTIGQMVKGGVWLNIIAAVLISIASMTLLVWVFGL